ncbi:MAG: transglutaminase domain-containing protein [Kiloniellaceae bacterium]
MVHAEYRDFLKRIRGDGRLRLVRLFHAVRNIPYGSAGVRDPVKVIENNVGSCSGKHILLRDLLRAENHPAEIVTIFTYFNERLPLHDSYPKELTRMIRDDKVCDFHHYVRAKLDGRWLRLDATWHDALEPYGFPVNSRWDGSADTVLAAEAIRSYPDVPDVAALKEELIASLPPEERAERARFFALLSAWVASLGER